MSGKRAGFDENLGDEIAQAADRTKVRRRGPEHFRPKKHEDMRRQKSKSACRGKVVR